MKTKTSKKNTSKKKIAKKRIVRRFKNQVVNEAIKDGFLDSIVGRMSDKDVEVLSSRLAKISGKKKVRKSKKAKGRTLTKKRPKSL